MDFSKLGQNEKLAVYGAIALIVGGVVGYSYGLTALGILAALAMLVIIFLPQLSAGTKLPGSRGSLMVAAGAVGGVAMALALLQAITGALFVNTNVRDILFLVAVAGAALMAWAGWQELQSEGGKFQLGTTAASGTSSAAPAAPAAPAEPMTTSAPPEPPMAAEPEAPADADDDPYRSDDEDRPTA